MKETIFQSKRDEIESTDFKIYFLINNFFFYSDSHLSPYLKRHSFKTKIK